jgi:hypothetical protein
MTLAFLLALVLAELPLARGVTWRPADARSGEPPQHVHELRIDLDDPDVVVRVAGVEPGRCASVDAIAEQAELVDGRPPVAAINFAFFSPWAPCLASSQAVSLVRQDGRALAANAEGGPRAALGWTLEGELLTTLVPAGADWPVTELALGARGLLIDEGRAIDPARWRDDELLADEFSARRHPRSALGIDLERNTMLWMTVDGRRASAAGMTLVELRERLLASEGLALDAAINLDGGGSTTLWIAGHGIVNQPSDASGPREVIGALLVYAAPLEPSDAREPLPAPALAEPEPDTPTPTSGGCRLATTRPSAWLLVLGLVAMRARRRGCNR